MRDFFKYAIVIIFIVAALVTPPDILTQLLMAGPLVILYGLSILIVRMVNPAPPLEDEEEDPSLKKADSPEALNRVLDGMEGIDQVIIDTQGLNPFDTGDIKNLAKMIGGQDIEPILVLAAGGDCEEMGETARVFATLGATRFLPTRIDIARRLGGLLAAAHQGGLSFADAGNTPKVADGLKTLSPQALSKLLMPGAFRERRPEQLQRTGTRR